MTQNRLKHVSWYILINVYMLCAGITHITVKKLEIVLVAKAPNDLYFEVKCDSQEICKTAVKKIYSVLVAKGFLGDLQKRYPLKLFSTNIYLN